MAKRAEKAWWTEAHGELLRETRLQKRLTQQEAGDRVGVSDDTFRNWENGKNTPRDDYLGAVAEFCDTTIAALMAFDTSLASVPPLPKANESQEPLPSGASERLESSVVSQVEPAVVDSTTLGPRRHSWVIAVALGAIVAGALSILAAKMWWRSDTFASFRALPDGIEALSASGKVLWRATGLSPAIAQRWTWMRMPDGRRLIACVLTKMDDFRPNAVSTISLLDPDAKRLHVVGRIQLPAPGEKIFPDYARRYDMAYIKAVDLDGDGTDELLVTYQEVPECVSYTILYEPVLRRARVVFAQTGAHHFTGAWDIDGDGRRDLVFLGINNGYDWMNSLSAVRVYPWIGARTTGDEFQVFSPDIPAYRPLEKAEIFYSLLPRGRVPDDPDAVSWDPHRRQFVVRLMDGHAVSVSALGFQGPTATGLSESEREFLRREAYRHNREARRLRDAGFFTDALAEARAAVASATRAADPIVTEVMQRDVMKLLIASGETKAGIAMAEELAKSSENASEIYYEAAVALHLAGKLDEAVAYYEAGIRHASPESGKSKHEYIQAEVFALAEQGKFAEAGKAIDRFDERYGIHDGLTAPYREFLRWRMGEVPNLIDVPYNATDLRRYWQLEFRNARKERPDLLLQGVDRLLAEGNRPRGALLSLRAILLDRIGESGEAKAEVRGALAESEREAKNAVVAKGHQHLVWERDRSELSPRPAQEKLGVFISQH